MYIPGFWSSKKNFLQIKDFANQKIYEPLV